VESLSVLCVNRLSEMGCLGPVGLCLPVDRRNEVGSINLSAESERVHLRYRGEPEVGMGRHGRDHPHRPSALWSAGVALISSVLT
jgi:hypothetical protein